MSIEAVNRRLRTQHGLITRAQALSADLSRGQIERRVGSGEWRIERRGVYRSTAVPPSFESQCLALVLARTAVISHRAAAALTNLDPFQSPRPHVTIPYGAREKGRNIHVSSQWHHRDQILRRGIPCTGVERTIMDCAGTEPLHVVEQMAESAIRQDLTSWGRFGEYVICHAKRGRDGSAGARELLTLRAGTPTVTRSMFSLRVLRLLVDAGIPKPVVEFPVRDRAGGHILAVDLAWPEQKKAWELDGLEWHFGRSDVFRDKTKRNDVKAQGWAIQEILWDMYLRNPDQLITWARDFLAA
ncbi:MAG: hypothetical protein ACI9TF_001625 [Paracrocinitomix sp.]|jgi:hypothetical protein